MVELGQFYYAGEYTMKKWLYLLVGVLIGALLSVNGSAFADQIQSLVGKTVAGEYDVKVNGYQLSESAIVVDGKAHVPLRAVSDSLGAQLNVSGKTIEITTGDKVVTEPTTPEKNEKTMSDKFRMAEQMGYEGDVSPRTLENLIKNKSELETRISKIEDNIELMKKSNEELFTRMNSDPYVNKTKGNERIERYKGLIEEDEKEIVALKEKIADLDYRIEILTKINQ